MGRLDKYLAGVAELADAGDSKSPGLKTVRVRPPSPAQKPVRDYVYYDISTGETNIVLVCLHAESLIEADYHFKEVIGTWPWTNKYIAAQAFPTCAEEQHEQS